MKRRPCLAGPIVSILLAPAASGVPAIPNAAAVSRPVAFVQAPASASSSQVFGIDNTILRGNYRSGMRIVLADVADIKTSRQIATEHFACAAEPTFSYDGARLAFAGSQSESEPLQIWELTLEGGNPSRLFKNDAACVSPRYLPNGLVLFASVLAGEYEEHGGQISFSLFAMESGASQPDRLTFNPSSDFDPAVLPDGRIMFSSWQHVGNRYWPGGIVALNLINSDGTGVFPLTGNHRGPWMKRAATLFGDERIAFIQSDRFVEFGAGTLVATSLNDLFSEYEVLLDEAEWQVSGMASLDGGELILSARSTADPEATFGLYRFANGKMSLLFDDPDYHELSPAIGGIRRVPEQRISTVVPETPFGYLAILNCYDTDRSDQHPLHADSIGTVRVIEGRPVRGDGRLAPEFYSVPGRQEEPLVRPNSATGYIPTRILGEVPPAVDGSVSLKVPADRPLRIQLVDRDGFSMISERAWFWVRPNERRVCIGCHEDRERAPSNAVALAVRREPTDLTDPAMWQTVTFRNDIQPILTANCAVSSCHVPPTPAAGLNLTADLLNGDKEAALAGRFGPAYANLLDRQANKPMAIGGRRVHPGDARSSPLLWMLYGRALAPQYKPAPFDRPMLTAHPGPMLPEAQLGLIQKWVDLGAQFDDVSAPGPWPYEIPRVNSVVLEGRSNDQ